MSELGIILAILSVAFTLDVARVSPGRVDPSNMSAWFVLFSVIFAIVCGIIGAA